MDRTPSGVELMEFARQKKRPVETGVEHPLLIRRSARHGYPPEVLVPYTASLLQYGIEISIAEFLEIPLGLPEVDEA